MSNNSWYFLKVNGNVERVEYEYEPNIVNEQWESIPAPQFLSVQEIADHQLKQLTVEDILAISKMEKEDLSMLHFGYGMWLRNSYGLWHDNNPFVIKDDLGDGHPDGLSMLVIKEIHKRLSPKDTAYQDAMSIIQEK